MKNNSFVFCNPRLATEAEELEKVGLNRFKSLDAFNADLKSLTRLLTRFAVPDIDWLYNETMFPAERVWYVGWHNETVVYREASEFCIIANALPLYEASAADRWEIAKQGLLYRLLQKATCVIKDKQAEEIISDELNP